VHVPICTSILPRWWALAAPRTAKTARIDHLTPAMDKKAQDLSDWILVTRNPSFFFPHPPRQGLRRGVVDNRIGQLWTGRL